MKTIALFNNADGVGKTSLVHHLAWMYADLGLNVLAADLDPQASLSGMFLDDERLEELWEGGIARRTIFGALQPLLDGTGDVACPHVEEIEPGLGLIVGDLALSNAEDLFSSQWAECLDRKPRAFWILSAMWRALRLAAQRVDAEMVLIDAGPGPGAVNRAALLAADHVVVPLTPDIRSVQGLRNLGLSLLRWREEWSKRRQRSPLDDQETPPGTMQPIGYIVMKHAIRLDRQAGTCDLWMQRIPDAYREAVLRESPDAHIPVEADPHCIMALKQYRSLMPLAQEARRPMFSLRPAHGAIGAHAGAVQDCYTDFRTLAREIARRGEVALS